MIASVIFGLKRIKDLMGSWEHCGIASFIPDTRTSVLWAGIRQKFQYTIRRFRTSYDVKKFIQT